MMPFSVLRTWLLGLLGLAVAITAAYLAWDWYRYDRDDKQLYWALGLGAISLLGRFAFIPFMGFGSGPPQLNPLETKQVSRPDGTKLHVNILQRGTGSVAVLTHGWTLNSTIWSYVQGEVPRDCEVIAWDLRGLGGSSKSPTGDYSLETMAGDLAEVVKLAGDRPVVLVGHSIGGMICQTFCRLYPGQLGQPVAAIVLVDTTHTNPVRTAALAPLWQAIQKPIIEPLLHLTVWLSPVVWLMNIQSYLNGTTQLITRFTSFAGAQSWGQVDHAARLSSFASPAVSARGMLAMLRFDETATLPNISVPTKVVVGANDRLTKPEASERIARDLADGRLSVADPGGHLSVTERHEIVNAAIAELVSRAARRSATSRASA
jgi:pimeloyl-ACP methyl ester carboxylesterase